MVPCWGMGEAGGGGAGPLVEPPGEGAALFVLRGLWRCGSPGATGPLPVGPLLTRCRGGGGANEVEGAGFPPGLGGHLLLTGDGGGFEGRGGVWFGDRDPCFSLVEEAVGGEGALGRWPTAGRREEEGENDGGSSGAELSSRWWLGGRGATARPEEDGPEEPSAPTFTNMDVCYRSKVTSAKTVTKLQRTMGDAITSQRSGCGTSTREEAH